VDPKLFVKGSGSDYSKSYGSGSGSDFQKVPDPVSDPTQNIYFFSRILILRSFNSILKQNFKEYIKLVSYNGKNYEMNPFFDGFYTCFHPVLDSDPDPDPKPRVPDPDPTKTFGSMRIRIHNTGFYDKKKDKINYKYSTVLPLRKLKGIVSRDLMRKKEAFRWF
jgi:hypothetical protein